MSYEGQIIYSFLYKNSHTDVKMDFHWFKVDDYSVEKRSLTGPEISWWFSDMKKKKIPQKNNLVIVEKISRFIRGLTAEDTNSQISQNRAR